MKTRYKILIPIAVLVVAASGLMLYTLAPMAGGLPSGPVVGGVTAIKDGMVNAFIVTDGADTIAIDSGTDPAVFRAELQKQGIDPAIIQAVFFTHADPDHIGGIPVLERAIKILPEAEVPIATGTAERKMLGMSIRSAGFPTTFETIKDGEIRSFGGLNVLTIATPGHTPGSTSYLVNGKWLFVGDLLMLRGGLAEGTWSFINNDNALDAQSIRNLAADPRLDSVEVLFSAHTGISHDLRAALGAFRN